MAEGEVRLVSRAEARAAGLKRYFTGKRCSGGHIADRFVSSRQCTACAIIKKNKWAERNRQAIAIYNTKYYARDLAASRLRVRVWQKNNPEKVKVLKRREYEKNKSKYKARMRNYRITHKDALKILDARKAILNPERYAAYKRNRKARKRNAEGHHSSKDVLNILRLQKKRCACCRVPLSMVKYHVDHIIPLARDGDNWPRNLQILCAPCNQSKSARDPIEFMQAQGRLL